MFMGEEDENGCVIFRRAELFKRLKTRILFFVPVMSKQINPADDRCSEELSEK